MDNFHLLADFPCLAVLKFFAIFPAIRSSATPAAPTARQRTDRRSPHAHIEVRAVQRLRLSFCKRNCCYLAESISAMPDPGIELKCFLRFLVQCGGCMKRRSARQLVRLLSDIRHAAHCSTLRAAATNRAIAFASAEEDADAADSDDRAEDNADAAREVHQTKPVRSGS